MKTGYVPELYCDETSPPPRDTPDAWIVTLASGEPALDGDDEQISALLDGDVVEFLAVTDHGRATLRIDAAGDWQVDPLMPAEATSVCALYGYQADTLSPDINGGVDALKEMGGSGEFTLSYYSWSEPMKHRFDASKLSFIRDAMT